jgi:serine protease Do
MLCAVLYGSASTAGHDAGDSLNALEEAALREAAESVADSVVQVRTIGGLDSDGGSLRIDGPTTGLVVSADGYILSSSFNFTQAPASILVTFASGKQAPAELVATDHSRMLVLLKVDGQPELPVASAVPAGELEVGQWALAVGRTFRTDQINVSVGILSATGRMYGRVIQTDADVSTANYGGPLVDIRGRVLGIIVPMAPQGADEVAGAEWYDSGIGFAVPLASLDGAIERMKRGEDQHSGILGIAMAPRNFHSSPAELAVVRPDSPAGLAGLQKGDRIVEVDGVGIETQTDLRFALGPRYGGERLAIVAMRGEERIERTIELASQLKAFRHAFLGVLPMRPPATRSDDQEADGESEARPKLENDSSADNDADNESPEAGSVDHAGVVVRMVYPKSPAADAGIEAGDRIVRLNGTRTRRIAEAVEMMNSIAPGTKVAIQVIRSGQPRELTATAAELPTNVPDALPSARENEQSPVASDADPQQQAPEGKTSELKLPEYPQSSQFYVPGSTATNQPLGVLVWIRAEDDPDAKEIIASWQAICDRDNLLLVVPQTADSERWQRTDLDYLRRLVLQVMQQHNIDPNRVVVSGRGTGGEMAWLLAISGRSLIRGVATFAGPLPRLLQIPENDPSLRLSIFIGTQESNDVAAARTAAGLRKLHDAGYPVTNITLSDSAGKLSDDERDELARWIDTLDRF